MDSLPNSYIESNAREELSMTAEKGFGPCVNAEGSTTCEHEVAENATSAVRERLGLGRRGSA